MKMTYADKMNKLGRGYEAGLVNYDSLTTGEKCMLTNYFSLKEERVDGLIENTNMHLQKLDERLDNIYSNLISME